MSMNWNNVGPSAATGEERARFALDLESAGYTVTNYQGRWNYDGPAVSIDGTDLQTVIRATSVELQWDDCGKTGLIVYPR